MNKMYKIKNSEGEYSIGGSRPYFNKNGKIWRNIGHLKNHFNLIHSIEKIYKDCQIEEATITGNNIEYKIYPVEEFIDNIVKEKQNNVIEKYKKDWNKKLKCLRDIPNLQIIGYDPGVLFKYKYREHNINNIALELINFYYNKIEK